MRASFLLWLFLLFLLITGCPSARRPYIAPVIPVDLSQEQVAGQTRCSLNNLPISYIHESLIGRVEREFIITHEQVHAEDMFNYKGGCWPFMYRYNQDKKFALEVEYRAYCKEGKLALERNIRPSDIWARIEKALSEMDSELSKRFKNCIY